MSQVVKTIAVSARSRIQIEKRSLAFLMDHMALGGGALQQTPIADWIEFEMEDALGVAFKVESLGPAVEAVTTPMKDGEWAVVMDDGVYHSMRAGDPRALFTAAHEVGHVVLHRDEVHQALVNGSPGLRRERGAILPFRDAEWQASAFASGLLAPVPAVKEICRTTPRVQWALMIHRAFGISMSAANVRISVLQHVGLLPQ